MVATRLVNAPEPMVHCKGSMWQAKDTRPWNHFVLTPRFFRFGGMTARTTTQDNKGVPREVQGSTASPSQPHYYPPHSPPCPWRCNRSSRRCMHRGDLHCIQRQPIIGARDLRCKGFFFSASRCSYGVRKVSSGSGMGLSIGHEAMDVVAMRGID